MVDIRQFCVDCTKKLRPKHPDILDLGTLSHRTSSEIVKSMRYDDVELLLTYHLNKNNMKSDWSTSSSVVEEKSYDDDFNRLFKSLKESHSADSINNRLNDKY